MGYAGHLSAMSAETLLPPGCEILVLEDDASLRKRVAAHLARLGAVVTECSTLSEARRLIDTVRFEFALVDLHLPDGSVLQLLREGIFSENTGVVVMTAFGGIKEAVDAIRLGAGDYLTKPFEPDQLPLAFQRCRSARRGPGARNTWPGRPTHAPNHFSLDIAWSQFERRLRRFWRRTDGSCVSCRRC
jgi:DNA-binding response OmpR family regulator